MKTRKFNTGLLNFKGILIALGNDEESTFKFHVEYYDAQNNQWTILKTLNYLFENLKTEKQHNLKIRFKNREAV